MRLMIFKIFFSAYKNLTLKEINVLKEKTEI